MTQPSTTLEAPDVADTAHFLRRFADLMSVGHNATYLLHAAVLLETLAARVTAATDEEQLWRYKYETVTDHADRLEAECDQLKHDIEGHLSFIPSAVAERDSLRTTLQAREAELSGLRAALNRERDGYAARLATHEKTLAELAAAVDREREAFMAASRARREEIDQLRGALGDEREERAARSGELSELRLAAERDRNDLWAQLKVREDELAALGAASRREIDELREMVAALESKRAELRAAFDRIGDLRHRTVEHQNGAGPVAEKPEGETDANPPRAQPREGGAGAGESNAVVPKTTLRQARAQFEFLANEFTGIGDVASRVMCELGAHSLDLALGADRKAERLAAGEIVQSVLARSPGPATLDHAGAH